MSKQKRLRVFAGPNGSGKSTLFGEIKDVVPLGTFINADNIEKELSEQGFLDLKAYNLDLSQADFDLFRRLESAKSLIDKSENSSINIYIKDNVIIDASKESDSYEASLVASFIRKKMYESGQSFSFETVMSHPSKLDEIKEAKNSGYRIYLYFVCLDDPELNTSRIQNRVEKGGHNVAHNKVKSRYYKTLKNLLPALILADRAYLFDNSDSMKLIAESHQGKLTIHYTEKSLPNWFIEYIINKL